MKCQSRSWSQRGTKVNESHHHGDDPLLIISTGIQIATKPLPGPTTREHRKLIGVKTMSLGTNYSFFSYLECCQYFRICIIIIIITTTSYTEDCLMCCPSTKVIKSDSKTFSTVAIGGLHFTSGGTDLFHLESILDRLRLLSPNHGQHSQQQNGKITLLCVCV